MPLSDPYSSYLDRLARQRAEDELMRSRLGEASKQFQGGLGQWNEALRVQKADTRQAAQDTAAAAERAEGLRLRKAADERDAATHDVALAAAKAKAAAAPTFADKAADAFTLVKPEEREPGEIVPEDVEGTSLSPEASDILMRLRASTEPGEIVVPPSPTSGFAPLKVKPRAAPTVKAEPTTKEQIEAERLGKAKADRLLAERKVQEMQRDPALANAPPTVLQFWGNVKGTAEQMRALGKEVTPDDFSLNAKVQSQMPTIAQSDRVRRVTSMIDRIVQRAGVGMEGGKLAEGDIARYRAMLMNAMDSYDGFTAATQEIAAELDKKIADEQAMFRQGSPAASGVPSADPQAAFLKTATDLAKQLGRKPTKEELQDAMRAAGVLE